MGANSKIEWTTHTFNPWWGCIRVSPACDHCYAESFAKRCGFNDPETLRTHDYAAAAVARAAGKFPIWGKGTRRRLFKPGHWDKLLGLARAATERERVFCGSMCDIMEDFTAAGVPVDQLPELETARKLTWHAVEHTADWFDWLLLTKRPQNFRRFLPPSWLREPRPNVWGMTTVESPEYLWRYAELCRVPFVVRGLSVEPLLAKLDLGFRRSELGQREWYMACPVCGGSGSIEVPGGGRACHACYEETYGGTGQLPLPNWVIVGGESGHGARPMHPDWVRSLRDQCVAAGVAFHFKQWGDWMPNDHRQIADERHWSLNPKAVTMQANGVSFPGEVTGWASMNRELRAMPFWRIGKEASGRMLDGRTWDEFPVTPYSAEVAHA